MNLIRLLIFALAAWVAWRMIVNYKVKQERLRQQRAAKPLDKDKMVRCAWCSVHLPQSSATAEGNLWFCDASHRARYLASDSSNDSSTGSGEA